MAYTYEWKIKNLKKATNANDLSDVIIGTQWIVTAINENGYSASFNGATPFKVADINTNNFTEFGDLTEEQVIGWIKEVVSGSNRTTNYWDHISEQIEKQLVRTTQVHVELLAGDLPWASHTTDTPARPTAHLDNE
jgi:fructosamine-3-kinase